MLARKRQFLIYCAIFAAVAGLLAAGAAWALRRADALPETGASPTP